MTGVEVVEEQARAPWAFIALEPHPMAATLERRMRRWQSEGKVVRQEMEAAEVRNTAAVEEALAPGARGRLLSAYQVLAVRHYLVDRAAALAEVWIPPIRLITVLRAARQIHIRPVAERLIIPRAPQGTLLKQAREAAAETLTLPVPARPAARVVTSARAEAEAEAALRRAAWAVTAETVTLWL